MGRGDGLPDVDYLLVALRRIRIWCWLGWWPFLGTWMWSTPLSKEASILPGSAAFGSWNERWNSP